MSDTFNLDRAQNEAHHVDAEGRKWTIKANRQNGLCHTRPEPDRVDAVIPKELAGQWTKPSLLAEKIKIYVSKSWDKAEAATQRAERKQQAAKEATKK